MSRLRGRLAWCAVALLPGLAACGDAQTTARATTSAVIGGIVLDHHILVDQFGYLPDESKVAVIRDPIVGYDKTDRFTPGERYQLRREGSGEAVLSGAPQAWNSGAVQASSGDRGWWFDFSAVNSPGRYYIYDVSRDVRSAGFAIGAEVYRDVLKAAMRTYYYQRSGVAKRPPYADACWADEAAYVGRNQDTEAHDVSDRKNAGKVRDLSGGWFDAGDTNKYVTFAVQPVHQLLSAYTANKSAFPDDVKIPESGNGVPDVIDEVRWETNWLKKMQFADGSFALKVGAVDYVGASPPSSDRTPRYYVTSCTSATIAGAGMLAHAAFVFAQFPLLKQESQDLGRRAVSAWRQYQASVKQTGCDSGVVHAGIADLSAEDQDGLAVEAAIYLYALTNDQQFDGYVQAHYREAHPYHDIGWSRYKPDQGDALLFYAALPSGAAALKATIVRDKLADVTAGNQIYGFNPEDDLYRAFLHDQQYHWGSNNPRANYGVTNLDAMSPAASSTASAAYRDRALGMLHYFHGVNPLGIVYLSNMYSYGATSSVNEIYHVWFAAKSRWSDAKTSPCGPAPGFVPGGPNADAAKDGVPTTVSPPVGQPPQKSYKDWNVATPENSWVVTEPGIYYQSAYVRLLSAFVH